MNLPAGPELDRLVAENVMGWTWKERRSEAGIGYLNYTGWWSDDWSTGHGSMTLWSPSTNISHAWEVVESLQTHNPFWAFGLDETGSGADFLSVDFSPTINSQGDRGWFCNFGDSTTGQSAPTLPHAICLAALAAVGHE